MKPLPVLGAVVIVLAMPLLHASAETPAAYDQALARVQGALITQAQAIRVEEVPTGEAPSLIARQVLTPIHSVETPGSAPQPVDNSQLITAITASEAAHSSAAKQAALEAVAQQIATLRSALVVQPEKGRPLPEPRGTLRSARAVLSRAEFAADPPPPPPFAERIAAWIDRLFASRQPNLPSYSGPNINPSIILGILILVAVAAFAVLVAVIVQAIGRRGARTKPLALDAEEAVLVEARDNDSLLALAEQKAKGGDFRRAFRLVYLATLVALDSGGVLRFDRSKTNWEYLRALRAAGLGDVYQAMTPLTREFDQVWYGFAQTDASHYARALAQYQAMLAAPKGAAGS